MSLQATIAKLMFSLPEGLQVMMAGGKPLTIEGRQLESQLQMVAWNGRNAPPMSSFPAEAVQAATVQQLAQMAAPIEPGINVEPLNIPSPEGHAIPARLYSPEGQDSTIPLIVYYHMGGGVIGDLDTCHAWCSILSSITKGPVLSIDYRLAPPHQYPAGLNDCFHAYEWGRANAERFGAPANKAAVGGDSMGGNFSAIIAQQMKAKGIPPVLQILIYPAVDLVTDYPSKASFANNFSLSTNTMDWFMDQYLPKGTDRRDLRLSPGLADDLSGLAPAIVATAGHDPLVDEGDLYAERLKKADVRVDHVRYDRLAHAFTAFTAFSPGSRRACVEIASLVRKALKAS